VHPGESVIKAGVLKDQADGVTHLVLLMNDVKTVKGGFPGGGPGESTEDIDGGGLAGAVGTQEAENLTRRNVKADVVDGDKLAGLFYQVVYLNDIIRQVLYIISRRTLCGTRESHYYVLILPIILFFSQYFFDIAAGARNNLFDTGPFLRF
jgi:hypothetical protein